MRIVNPATGTVLRDIPEADYASVAQAVERARQAQPAWAATSVAERSSAIARFRALIVERTETLARIVTLEVGKPIAQARRELAGLLGRIDFFMAEIAATMADQVVAN